MSTQRDELARIVNGEGAWCGECEFEGWDSCAECRRSCRGFADAILAAGWTKPRTITEYYGDEGIESLPCGSVILAGITTSTLQSDGTWLDSWGSTYDFYELNLPATVLYEPTA